MTVITQHLEKKNYFKYTNGILSKIYIYINTKQKGNHFPFMLIPVSAKLSTSGGTHINLTVHFQFTTIWGKSHHEPSKKGIKCPRGSWFIQLIERIWIHQSFTESGSTSPFKMVLMNHCKYTVPDVCVCLCVCVKLIYLETSISNSSSTFPQSMLLCCCSWGFSALSAILSPWKFKVRWQSSAPPMHGCSSRTSLTHSRR